MHDTTSSDFQVFVDLGTLQEISFQRTEAPLEFVNLDNVAIGEQEEDEDREEGFEEGEEEEHIQEDDVEEDEQIEEDDDVEQVDSDDEDYDNDE
ncbi:uncharacterized protein LOC133785805 [Humulus lupulus]|uniref:uncharacterized protein LOC133785805 n=1 Tax=Humulus lupulus TaxID=3486 RepID=UPI002B417B84|nr:uncharacterized protein LOC133785805 [Humulus lupulus]